MRIVLFASGDFAIPTLRSLVDHGQKVAAVVTQPDRGSGRGRQSRPTPVAAQATELGLSVIRTADVNSIEALSQLRDYPADVGLVIAFGQKIGPVVRGLYRHECVNLHASLLPAYRGAAPYQWALINGEERTGVTVFRLVERMDAGPIYATRWTFIKPEERAGDLHDRLARIGVDAVEATLEILEHDPAFQPAAQDERLATRAPKLHKEDGFLDFAQPALSIARRICGLWPWPGATCVFQSAATGRQERITLALARMAAAGAGGAGGGTGLADGEGAAVTAGPADAAGTPGAAGPAGAEGASSVAGAVHEEPGILDYRLHAATGDGWLEILEVKPESGRLMSFEDFVNGRHVRPGDRLLPGGTAPTQPET